MKKFTLAILIGLIFSCCAVIFGACSSGDYVGSYELKSFTASDGTKYNVGDEYDGNTLKANDITLTIKQPVQLVVGQSNSKAGQASLISNVSESSSRALWKKVTGGIEIADYLDSSKVYKAKLRGSTLTVRCPSGMTVNEIVMTKVS